MLTAAAWVCAAAVFDAPFLAALTIGWRRRARSRRLRARVRSYGYLA